MQAVLRTIATAGFVLAACLAAQPPAQAQVYDQCSSYPPGSGYKSCVRLAEIRYESCRRLGRPRLRCLRQLGADKAQCRKTWCTISAPVRRR